MKNFDQWIEALKKDINFQTNQENTRVLLIPDRYFDDDFEDEE